LAELHVAQIAARAIELFEHRAAPTFDPVRALSGSADTDRRAHRTSESATISPAPAGDRESR